MTEETEKIQITTTDAAEALGIGAILEWHVDPKTGSLCIEYRKPDKTEYKPFKPIRKVAAPKKVKPAKPVKAKGFLERVFTKPVVRGEKVEEREPFGMPGYVSPVHYLNPGCPA